jgi:hypothetical protein
VQRRVLRPGFNLTQTTLAAASVGVHVYLLFIGVLRARSTSRSPTDNYQGPLVLLR